MDQPRGIVFFVKPPGITSFTSLGALKQIYGIKKIGHTGTLDKFAQGVMIACVGKYTKLSKYIISATKSYIAVIQVGTETDTLDPEGEIVARGPQPSMNDFEKLLPEFTGEIQQEPPVYSAIHIQGKRAHERVRKGESVIMPKRTVTIQSLKILSYKQGKLTIEVNCSKGTYIRSLARDITKAAGTCGYLSELTRTSVGPVLLRDCSTFEEIAECPGKHLHYGVSLCSNGILPFDTAILKKKHEKDFYNGKTMRSDWFEAGIFQEKNDGKIAVMDSEGNLSGIIGRKSQGYFYDCVFHT